MLCSLLVELMRHHSDPIEVSEALCHGGGSVLAREAPRMC